MMTANQSPRPRAARGVKIEDVGPCLHPLPIDAEQAGCVVSQDRRLLLVGETFGGTDMIDRMLLPGDGMVAAEHDLTCAEWRHQVAQCLGSEYQRVEIELVQIFGRLLLQLDVRVAILRRDEAGVVGARRVGAEISAAMRGKDLEAGKAIERAFEDQVLERDGGIEGVADEVRQPAVALEALGELQRALRVDEQDGAEFLRLRPYRGEIWDWRTPPPQR